jgi:hypothetical protein
MNFSRLDSWDAARISGNIAFKDEMCVTKPTFAGKIKNAKNNVVKFWHAKFPKDDKKQTRSLGRFLIESLIGPKGEVSLFSGKVKAARQVIKELCKNPNSKISMPEGNFANAVFDLLWEHSGKQGKGKVSQEIIEGVTVKLRDKIEGGLRLVFSHNSYHIHYDIQEKDTENFFARFDKSRRDAGKQISQDNQPTFAAQNNAAQGPADDSEVARFNRMVLDFFPRDYNDLPPVKDRNYIVFVEALKKSSLTVN